MQKLQLYNKANYGSFATILDPTYHWAGCARENHCTHAAVSLISDAQWKHSSVEYEIVFHVIDAAIPEQQWSELCRMIIRIHRNASSAMKSLQSVGATPG